MNTSKEKPVRLKRRWWQVALRFVIVTAMVLVAAYITFPWWAPRGMLRDWLARDLERQLGVPVSVGGLNISWADGVEIKDLTIASANGFGPQPMLLVPSLRTEYSPIRLLMQNRLEWVELTGPRIIARVNEQGDSNLEPLLHLMGQKMKIRRMSVRRASAWLDLPRQSRLLRLDVSDMQVVSGKTTSLGSITLSADLRQGGQDVTAPAGDSPATGAAASHPADLLPTWAPMGLQLAGGEDNSSAAVSAALSFSGVDLDQLHVPELLGAFGAKLPVRALSGRCSGSVNLQIDRQAVVEGFSLNVSVRKLGVLPLDGPALPTIDEALLRVAATFDLAVAGGEGRIDIQSMSLRLPGILELSGDVSLYADWFAGNWQALRSLKIDGQADLARLSTLLQGRLPRPGELTLDGLVPFHAWAQHDPRQLNFNVSADCTAAQLRDGLTLLKPASRPMRMELAGTFDSQSQELRLDQARAELDTNMVTCSGTVRNTGKILEAVLAGNQNPAGDSPVIPPTSERSTTGMGPGGRGTTLDRLRQCVDLVDLSGSVEVRQLSAIRELLPRATDLKGLRLEGLLEGKWNLKGSEGGQASCSLQAPSATALAWEGLFAKPAGEEFKFEASATLAKGLELRDASANLQIGPGHLAIRKSSLRVLRDESSGRPTGLKSGGQFQCDSPETFLACLVRPPANLALQGGLSGNFSAHIVQDGPVAISVDGDIETLHVTCGSLLDKPAGQPAEFRILYTDRLHMLELPDYPVLSGALILPAVKIGATLGATQTSDGFAWDPAKYDLAADFADAAAVAQLCPAVGVRLGAKSLSGPMSVHASGTLRTSSIEGDLEIDANETVIRLPGQVPRTKAAGTRCKVIAKGSWALSALQDQARLDSLDITLGENHLAASGLAQFSHTLTIRGPSLELTDFGGKVDAQFVAERALFDLLPELAVIRDWGVAGSIALSGKVEGDNRKGITLKGHLDGKDFAARQIGPFALAYKGAGERPQSFWVGPLVKPLGRPAEGDLELSLSADGCQAKLVKLGGKVGPLNFQASGEGDILRTKADAIDGISPRQARLALWVEKAEDLPEWLPWLKNFAPQGDARLELECKSEGNGLTGAATFATTGLHWDWNGKQVLVRGRIGAKDAYRDATGQLHVGSVSSDGLELAAGENRGWIVADLADLLNKPTGSLDVHVEHIDDQDLAKWLEPIGAQTQPAAATKPDVEEALRKANVLLEKYRALAAAANLKIHVDMDHFRTFDPNVEQTYDVRCVNLDVVLADGKMKIGVDASINGGVYQDPMTVDLSEKEPRIVRQTKIREVIATANIQPQLAVYFPGNTVNGTFSRTEQSTVGLAESLANMIDPRFRVFPVGSAVTVTTDGLLLGRAAPKFVTTLFPGLNLTAYRYNKMTAFAQMNADGSADNDMIFDGQSYSLYIEGNTDPGHIGRYNLGLILGKRPQSPEWNHQYRLGRLLLLTIKARIEGGKLNAEEVSFPWPTEALGALFIQNNPIYRLWVTESGK